MTENNLKYLKVEAIDYQRYQEYFPILEKCSSIDKIRDKLSYLTFLQQGVVEEIGKMTFEKVANDWEEVSRQCCDINTEELEDKTGKAIIVKL
jgi:hypothetical protein